VISPKVFVEYLASKAFRFYTGVPCSYFKNVIRYIEDQHDLSYVMAPNEGSALGLASGAYLGGQPAVVMIQNSGLGNLINPLTSLNAIYQVPVLIFVSGRAYGIADEPQHEIMGKKMTQLLEALDCPYWELPQEENALAGALDKGIEQMMTRKKPVVFLVRQGTFGAYAAAPASSAYPMKRIDALAVIRECLGEEDLIFATTGKPSREFFAIGDRPGNFYMQGSMGHIGALALGTALARPDRRIVVVDGDGAFLMHMGIVSSIGHYGPKNLVHLVVDNESYETTGDQNTTSVSTDFEAIAKACGYRAAVCFKEQTSLRQSLPHWLRQDGPVLVRIKVNRQETKDIPRITTRYTAAQIAESFKNFVEKTPVPE